MKVEYNNIFIRTLFSRP